MDIAFFARFIAISSCILGIRSLAISTRMQPHDCVQPDLSLTSETVVSLPHSHCALTRKKHRPFGV